MTSTREKSMVRFEPQVEFIDRQLSFQTPHASTSSAGVTSKGQGSSSAPGSSRVPKHQNHHQYIPRLHRQITEIPPQTPLGSALQQFASTRLVNEFSVSKRCEAVGELKQIIGEVFTSVSRNLLNLKFLPPVYSLGFCHWEARPSQRVVCYMPVKFPRIEEIHPKLDDAVWIQLPPKFPDSINITPASLSNIDDHSQSESESESESLFLSSIKLYTVVAKLLRRALLIKSTSVRDGMFMFCPSTPTIEVQLPKTAGWVGEIVPCVTSGPVGILYSCRPYQCHHHPHHQQQQEEESGQGMHNVTRQNIDLEGQKNKKAALQLQSHSQSQLHKSSANIDLGGDFLTNSQISMAVSLLQINTEKTESIFSTSSSSDDDVDEAFSSSINLKVDDVKSMILNPSGSKHLETSNPKVSAWPDVSWYPCNPRSENKLVDSVSRTDGGVRMSALMIVCILTQHDWHLLPLACYHVMTAMLHDTEHHLDNSPRWQRNSLENCVQSLLLRLNTFVSGKDGGCNSRLPHFSVTGIDLWSSLTRKQLDLARSGLRRLCTNDTALVSLVCRAGNIRFETISQPN